MGLRRYTLSLYVYIYIQYIYTHIYTHILHPSNLYELTPDRRLFLGAPWICVSHFISNNDQAFRMQKSVSSHQGPIGFWRKRPHRGLGRMKRWSEGTKQSAWCFRSFWVVRCRYAYIYISFYHLLSLKSTSHATCSAYLCVQFVWGVVSTKTLLHCHLSSFKCSSDGQQLFVFLHNFLTTRKLNVVCVCCLLWGIWFELQLAPHLL